MKIIIAGGRDFDDFDRLEECVNSVLPEVSDTGYIIVCGGAKGADMLGEKYQKKHKGMGIEYYFPEWDTHGKAAGPIRNKEMALNADMLIAFWDGKSRETKNMIDEALKHGLEVHVYRYEKIMN